MLLTKGDGKRFSRKWNEDRARALIDSTKFTADELTDLDVNSTEGRGVNNRHTYEVEIVPVDPNTRGSKGKYDMRKRGDIM